MSIGQGFADSSGFLLARLGVESRRMWARMLAEHDLTTHQFVVLMTLDSIGETYQQRLAAFLGVDPRNAVSILDGLRRRELVERTPDPADRRRHLLRLSAAGRRLSATLRESGARIEGELLGGLDADERATLHRLLRKAFSSLHGGSE